MKSRPLAPSPVKHRWMLLMNFLNKEPLFSSTLIVAIITICGRDLFGLESLNPWIIKRMQTSKQH